MPEPKSQRSMESILLDYAYDNRDLFQMWMERDLGEKSYHDLYYNDTLDPDFGVGLCCPKLRKCMQDVNQHIKPTPEFIDWYNGRLKEKNHPQLKLQRGGVIVTKHSDDENDNDDDDDDHHDDDDDASRNNDDEKREMEDERGIHKMDIEGEEELPNMNDLNLDDTAHMEPDLHYSRSPPLDMRSVSRISRIDEIIDDHIIPQQQIQIFEADRINSFPSFSQSDLIDEDIEQQQQQHDDDDESVGDDDDQIDDDLVPANLKKRVREWSTRTAKTVQYLHNKSQSQFSFQTLMEKSNPKTVAGVFYELLVLKNHNLIELQQNQAFDDIKITKTADFKKYIKRNTQVSQSQRT